MRKWNKFFALLCALMLALGSMSLGSFAEEGSTEQEIAQQEEAARIAAEEEAARIAAEEEAARKAAEEEAARKAAEEEAARKAAEEEAARKAAEEEAARKAAEEEAARKAAEEEAARKAAEEEAAKQAEEAAAEQPSEEATAEPAAEEVPAEQPAEEATAEPAAEEVPAEQPAEEATAEPVEEETEDQVVEETAPEAAAEDQIVNQAVEEELLFEINGDRLIGYYGTDKEVFVPDGVRVIGTNAFSDNAIIEKVTLPDSVEIIESRAFESCINLAKVIIGKESKLTTIAKDAFKNAKRLDIHFADDIKDVDAQAFDESLTAYAKVEKKSEDLKLQSRASTLSITAGTEDDVIIAAPGETVTIGITAQGATSYQWQYRTSESGTWVNLNNAKYKAASFDYVVKATNDGYQYQCVVSDGTSTIISGTITLKILKITDQTEGELKAAVGDEITIAVEAENATAYQWQYRTSESGTWKSLSSAAYKAASFNYTVKESNNGYQYRCLVSNGDSQVISETITLIVVPKITVQPDETITANVGETVTIGVEATGASAYQWQYRTSAEGEWKSLNSATYKKASFNYVVKATNNGYQYRCLVSNSVGNSVESDAATLVIPLKITEGDEDGEIIAAAGETVTIGITAQGATSYQWQYRTSESGTWVNLNNAKYKAASFDYVVKATNDGYQYQCVVSDGTSTIISGTITLKILKITDQTEGELKAAVGDEITIAVEAENATAYQWQYRTSESGTWKSLSSAAYKAASFNYTVKESNNGYQYRCLVSNGDSEVISEPITLIVVPKITKQPDSLIKAAVGQTITISVEASGATSYQWQYRTSSEGEWKSLNSAKFRQPSFDYVVKESNNGYQYRCIVTNAAGNSIESESATLTLGLAIMTQPKNTSALVDDEVTLSVKAFDAEAYQWQYRSGEDAAWADIEGATAETYTLKVTADDHGSQYRCVVSNDEDSVESEAATITVFMLLAQSSDIEIEFAPETFEVSVEAQGAESYQWMYRTNENAQWTALNSAKFKQAMFTHEAKISNRGFQYKCVITDADGHKIESEPVTLSILGFTTGKLDYLILEDETTVGLCGYNAVYTSADWDNSLTVPEKPETGYTVTEIGEEAFMGNTALTSIDLPDTITVIRARAFKDCTNLKEMK